jgi:hypothetical protein
LKYVRESRPLLFERSEFNGLAFFAYFLGQCQKVGSQEQVQIKSNKSPKTKYSVTKIILKFPPATSSPPHGGAPRPRVDTLQGWGKSGQF